MMHTHAPVSSNLDVDGSTPKGRNWEFKWRPGRASLAFVGVAMVVGAFISANVQQIHKRGMSTGKFSSMEQLVAAMPSNDCKQNAEITVKGIKHNNLGGVGPDTGDETLIYDLSMGSESFFMGSESFLLEVSQVSSNKGAVVHNGFWKDKGMGKITILGGQTVRVRFQFFDKETRAPKRIPKFAFAFYDLGQHDEPMTLNRQQRDRAVTLTFADSSGFEANLGNTGQKANSKSYRAVLFAPKATLDCTGTQEPISTTTLSTTKPATKPGGAETTTKKSNDCMQVESKGRAADNVADLEKMILEEKYVKTAVIRETFYFTSKPTDLCTAFADTSGSKHKVCIGAWAGCKAKMVWKTSGGLQFHNKEFGGEDAHVALPTSETTLIVGTFESETGGFYDGEHMKLILQGYKSATSQ